VSSPPKETERDNAAKPPIKVEKMTDCLSGISPGRRDAGWPKQSGGSGGGFIARFRRGAYPPLAGFD